MPKLTASALINDINLQDPFPTDDKLVITLPLTAPVTEVETDITRGQLERLREQMVALEAQGYIRWSVDATDLDDRADEYGYAGLPMLSFIDLATSPLSIAAGVANGIITGTNLLGGQVKDHVTVGDPTDPNNWMRVELLDADPVDSGDANTGGFFTLAIVDAGPGNPQAVNTYTAAVGTDPYDPTFVPAIIILESDFANAAHTWATLGTIVNALGGGTPTDIIRCAWDVGTDPITAAVATTRSSGLLNGSGHSLTIGGAAATINFINDTTVDYSIASPIVGAAGDYALIELRTNDKLATMSAPIVA
jgi:hypothetical protein